MRLKPEFRWINNKKTQDDAMKCIPRHNWVDAFVMKWNPQNDGAHKNDDDDDDDWLVTRNVTVTAEYFDLDQIKEKNWNETELT